MGGADSYCSISGIRYFDESQICNAILDLAQENEDDEEVYEESDGDEDEEDNRGQGKLSTRRTVEHLSEKIKKGLLCTEEDMSSSSNFVLLCPYETLDDGTVLRQASIEDPQPTQITDLNIMEVFNIVPGQHPDLGMYDCKDITDNYSYVVMPSVGNTLIIAYTAYLILRQAAPKLRPYMIYALSRQREHTSGQIDGVDYGPVTKIVDQYAHWAAIIDSPSNSADDVGRAWKNLLTQEGKTDDEIIHDAWQGPGNMWVFVRPDRFPVAEALSAEALPTFSTYNQERIKEALGVPTLEKLPPDVLLTVCEFLPIRSIFVLMTTCNRFRARILPRANAIARRRLLDEEPWFLPAGPFELKDRRHGREEVDWWAAQCAAGGIAPEEVDVKFPWLLYRRECSKSMSMWNRKRIWNVVKQIESLAVKKKMLS